MSYVTLIETEQQQEAFLHAPGMPALAPATVAQQKPEAMLLHSSRHGAVLARCSLWWSRAPLHETHRVGLIGHYAALDDAAAAPLLQRACALLTERGCTMAVGPMDGNTWQSYRLLTERGTEPVFFLEPDNPDSWPQHFTLNGFTPLAQYYSALVTDLSLADPRLSEIAERMNALGVVLRPLRADDFVNEMARIYAVSEISFQRNFLYTPIPCDEFIAQYAVIRPHVQPDLVLLAEHAARPVGFVFALPDLTQARRGENINTAIIKTVAVLPEARFKGLGSLLVARSHIIAREAGFRRVIHALMHEDNRSRNISAHYARPLRRYTLYARSLV